MRIKICRKGAKESRYWLRLVDAQQDSELQKEQTKLEKEADELLKVQVYCCRISRYHTEKNMLSNRVNGKSQI